MRNGDLNMRNGDLNMRNGDLNMRNGDLNMRNGDLNMRNGDLNMRNGDLNMCNGDLNMCQAQFKVVHCLTSAALPLLHGDRPIVGYVDSWLLGTHICATPAGKQALESFTLPTLNSLCICLCSTMYMYFILNYSEAGCVVEHPPRACPCNLG